MQTNHNSCDNICSSKKSAWTHLTMPVALAHMCRRQNNQRLELVQQITKPYLCWQAGNLPLKQSLGNSRTCKDCACGFIIPIMVVDRLLQGQDSYNTTRIDNNAMVLTTTLANKIGGCAIGGKVNKVVCETNGSPVRVQMKISNLTKDPFVRDPRAVISKTSSRAPFVSTLQKTVSGIN